jgi:hypothetical protein
MLTAPLDIAGGRARWIAPTADAGTWLEWTQAARPPARVPFAHLRWSTDVLAGADGPSWAKQLPTVVQLYDDADSWIFHPTRLEPMYDLPCRPGGRWSVYRWAREWVVEYHPQVASPGAAMPLIVALTAVLGCGPSAIR